MNHEAGDAPEDDLKRSHSGEGNTGRVAEEIHHRIDEDRKEEEEYISRVIRKLRTLMDEKY